MGGKCDWIIGGGGKASESGYILKIELTGLKNGLAVECKKISTSWKSLEKIQVELCIYKCNPV